MRTCGFGRVSARAALLLQEVPLNVLDSSHMSERSYGDGSSLSVDLLKSKWTTEKKLVLLAAEHHRKPNRCFAPRWGPLFGFAKHAERFVHLGLISSNATSET